MRDNVCIVRHISCTENPPWYYAHFQLLNSHHRPVDSREPGWLCTRMCTKCRSECAYVCTSSTFEYVIRQQQHISVSLGGWVCVCACVCSLLCAGWEGEGICGGGHGRNSLSSSTPNSRVRIQCLSKFESITVDKYAKHGMAHNDDGWTAFV